MTDRQTFALANPLDPADLGAVSRSAQRVASEHQGYLTMLTVDKSDGLWWHAGVSVLSSNLKAVPHSGLSNLQRKAAERLVRELLNEVGRPDSEELSWDDRCVHLIRRLTIEEERKAKSSSTEKTHSKRKQQGFLR